MGVPLGLVLSTGVVRLTSGVTGTEGFAAFGWRIPFILSIVLIGVGMFVRLRVVESPEFEAVRKSNKVVKNPILEVISNSGDVRRQAAVGKFAYQKRIAWSLTGAGIGGRRGRPRGRRVLCRPSSAAAR